MNGMVPVGLVLFGTIIGAVVVWLTLRARATQRYEAGRADSVTQLATLNERLASKDRELQRLQDAFEKERAELSGTKEQNSHLKADLEGERRAAQERSESFKQAAEALAEKFKALSRDALKDNNQEFLNLARATLEKFQVSAKGELDQRQQAIDQLVKPLKDSLEKVDGKIGELEKARAGAYAELREQVRNLATSQLQLQAETGTLVKALRTPHTRGRW